jgi:hypothetical protein
MISTARPFALGLSKGRRTKVTKGYLVVLNFVNFVPFSVKVRFSASSVPLRLNSFSSPRNADNLRPLDPFHLKIIMNCTTLAANEIHVAI